MSSDDTAGLGRRHFLRGLGAALALPALESLRPRRAWAQPVLPPPPRVLYYYIPNGFLMEAWHQALAAVGDAPLSSLSTLPGFLQPLTPQRQKLLLVSGLNNASGNFRDGDLGSGAHFQNTASFLTSRHVTGKEPSLSVGGRSIDQEVAAVIGGGTPHRSLQLTLSPGVTSNPAGWPLAYLGFVSWANATTPLTQLASPAVVFDALFAASANGVSPMDLARRKARRQKVLDTVRGDASSLRGRLGSADRRRLDEYLTSVDELDVRLNAPLPTTCSVAMPPAPSSDHPQRLAAMHELMRLALQCNQTRVLSFMRHAGGASFGSAYSFVTHQGSPLTEQKHVYSHYTTPPQGDTTASAKAKLAAINAWEFAQLGHLLQQLDGVDEGAGTLLDNTLVFFSSECGDPNSHSSDDVPIVIAGKAGGAVRPDRLLRFNAGPQAPTGTWADLQLGIAHGVGATGVTAFGEDGTRPLPLG